MPSLYSFVGSYNDIWEMLNDPDIDLQMLEDTLQAIEGDIEHKAENIIRYIRNLKTDAEAIKAEEQRLAAKRRAAENGEKRMRAYLQNCLQASGLSKVKTTIATVSLASTKGGVEIVDLDALPDAYIARIERVPDKTAIGNALKEGQEVPGARLTEPKPTITIR